MSAMTLAKNGKRYSHEEWMTLMRTGEASELLLKYGPAYTDEAWEKHFGNKKVKVGKWK